MFTYLGYKLGIWFDEKEWDYYLQRLGTTEYMGGKGFLFGGFGALVDLFILCSLIFWFWKG